MTTVTHTLVFLLILQRQYRLKLLFNTCLQFVKVQSVSGHCAESGMAASDCATQI